MIYVVDRIITAVGKHIVAEHTCAGRNKDICIDEATYRWIVISALQIIEACFLGRILAKRSFGIQ